MKKTLAITLLASTFTLAACGGGGDGDGDSTSTYSYTGPTAAVTLDSSNIGSIAANAMSSNEMLFDQGIPLVSVASISEETTQSVFDATTDLLEIATNNIQNINADSQLVSASATYSCADGGSVFYDGDISEFQDDTLSVNDSLSVTFNSCTEGGTTINGTMSLTVTSAEGDYVTPSGTWELGYTISFNQLSIDGTSLLMHGGMSFTVGDDGSQYTSISGSSLFVMSGTQQALLSNFNMSVSVNTSGDTTVNSDYTYAGTDIGGSITVDTTTPFFTSFGNSYPETGEMIITGAGGATILVRAIDATQVYLEWDIDPIDGNPDNNATIPWTQLATWSPTPPPTGSVAAGQSKYDADCASCHAAGSYDPLPAEIASAGDLLGTSNLIVNDLRPYGGMNSVDILTDQEVLDLKAFIDSL